ncbi:site-2 protease family protein [Leifsonia shinshuensis]|uniref:M50 family metallopeptidase n=1 Tax=Leifsonia shinshuensis TaxID=150026 RepID=UPI001F50BC79|nr:site-2 protease family protein [Leifsonia shinshuensis]MCI0155527.1 site-2 protease family protein [Leifsonia shinshuensis]
MDSVLLFILGVVIILIGVALSIALHEIGHLVPAKLFGVKVTQYMIGFGRTLFSVKKGETEYGIKAIPLGGYISMIGMFPPGKEGGSGRNATTGFMQAMVQDARTASSETVLVGEEDRTFYRLAVWKRIIIMFGGPFMNLLIATVLFGVILMGFGTPQNSTTIGSVNQCVLPATSTSQTCAPGDPAGPAAAAGLKPGDTIVSIDGQAITTWAQSTAIIRDSADRSLAVVVRRDGQERTVTLVPKTNTVAKTDANGQIVKAGDGSTETLTAGFVGIGSVPELVPQPITSVLPAVGAQTGAVVGVVIHLPQRMVDVWNAAFGSGKRDPNGPMSLVGVGRAAGELTALDGVPVIDKVYTMLGILASLNVALFVFNLIPLLPLDGGHIAGALWEGFRRSIAKLFKRRDPGPVDMAKLMPLTMAVVVVLGGMSLLLMYADIVKPVNLFG